MGKRDDEAWWEFPGYAASDEGQPVQDWVDSLSSDARDEIINLLRHQSYLPRGLWSKPEFDPLKGEEGISELRPNDVRCATGTETYRLYGWFGPRDHDYMILHGTKKDRANDRLGKQIAKGRLAKLLAGKAQPHKLDFSGRGNRTPPKRTEVSGNLLEFKPRSGVGVPAAETQGQDGLESNGAGREDGNESKRNL